MNRSHEPHTENPVGHVRLGSARSDAQVRGDDRDMVATLIDRARAAVQYRLTVKRPGGKTVESSDDE